jgi:hypothetical protein
MWPAAHKSRLWRDFGEAIAAVTYLNSARGRSRWADEPVKPVTATIDANGIQVRPPDQQQRQSVDCHAMAAEAAARALEEQERRQ